MAMDSPTPPRSEEHITFLDYFRGLAILLVFADHCVAGSFAFGPTPFQWNGIVRDFDTPLSNFLIWPGTLGWLGVPIFFVISGFCIHLSHERSARKDFTTFFIRRFFRIYPAYLVALLVFAFLFPWSWLCFKQDFSLATMQLWTHLLLVHNFFINSVGAINGSFWSIAIEVQLYVLYPVLFFLSARLGWRRVIWLTCAIEMALRAYRAFYFAIPMTDWLIFWDSLPLNYWYTWSIGAALAEAYVKKQPLPFNNAPLFFWPSLTFLVYCFKPFTVFIFPFVALSTARFIAHFLQRRQDPSPPSRPVSWLLEQVRFAGIISYSAYLLHTPLVNRVYGIVHALLPHYPFAPAVLFIISLAFWAIIAPLSYLFYRLVELPSIAFGKEIIRKRKPLVSIPHDRAARAGE